MSIGASCRQGSEHEAGKRFTIIISDSYWTTYCCGLLQRNPRRIQKQVRLSSKNNMTKDFLQNRKASNMRLAKPSWQLVVKAQSMKHENDSRIASNSYFTLTLLRASIRASSHCRRLLQRNLRLVQK